MPIKTDLYPSLFKYKVYECFKPRNLMMARNYIQYLIHGRDVVKNEDVEQYESELVDTRMPDIINSKKLLQFQSNFEAGNLDSAYLVNEHQYNLLLKVDTNTKGHTHWFYFKIANWQPGHTYTFNVVNMSRDLSKFYFRGMNVLTQLESPLDGARSDWSPHGGTRILQIESQNQIVRRLQPDGTPKSYYSTLRFEVKFPLADSQVNIDDGTVRQASGMHYCFAYALPYVYTDLLTDLQHTKKLLLDSGGSIKQSVAPQFVDLPKISNKAGSNLTKKASSLQSGAGGPGQPYDSAAQQFKDRTQEYKKMQTLLQKQSLKTQATQSLALTQDERRLMQSRDPEVAEERSRLLTEIQSTSTEVIELGTLVYQQEVISCSVGGLNVYQLSITAKSRKPDSAKQVIYIQSRLHAAETHGSFVMKKLIQQIVKNPQTYEKLLQNYVVRLIPMINADGVTMGNSRCSLVGVDLNRRWANPNCIIHPEIYFLKQRMLNATGKIQIFIDLHGHNKRENCFFYGCNKAADEGMVSWTKTRLLPKILASIEPIFDYSKCRFHQDKSKLNTARVVVWSEMNCFNSFTLEVSMFGSNTDVSFGLAEKAERQNAVQFLPPHLEQIGQSLLKSVFQYIKLVPQLHKDQWLKPSQLVSLGGESARVRLIKDMHEQKVNRKRGLQGVPGIEQHRYTNTSISSRQQHAGTKNNNLVEIYDAMASSKDALPLTANSSAVQRPKHSQPPLATTAAVSERFKVGKLPPKKINQASKSLCQSSNDGNDSSSVNGEQTGLPAVGAADNWRRFFKKDELEQGRQFIRSRLEKTTPIEEQSDDSEGGASDSSPSCDNLDPAQIDSIMPFKTDNEAILFSDKKSLQLPATPANKLQHVREVNESILESQQSLDQMPNDSLCSQESSHSLDAKENSQQLEGVCRRGSNRNRVVVSIKNITDFSYKNQTPVVFRQDHSYQPQAHLRNNHQVTQLRAKISTQGQMMPPSIDFMSGSPFSLIDDDYSRALSNKLPQSGQKRPPVTANDNLAFEFKTAKQPIQQQRHQQSSGKQSKGDDFQNLKIMGVQSTALRSATIQVGSSPGSAQPQLDSKARNVNRRRNNLSSYHEDFNSPSSTQQQTTFTEHMQALKQSFQSLKDQNSGEEIQLSKLAQEPAKLNNTLNLKIKNPAFVYDQKKRHLVQQTQNQRSPVPHMTVEPTPIQKAQMIYQSRNPAANLEQTFGISRSQGQTHSSGIAASGRSPGKLPPSLHQLSPFNSRKKQIAKLQQHQPVVASQLEICNTSTRVPARATLHNRLQASSGVSGPPSRDPESTPVTLNLKCNS